MRIIALDVGSRITYCEVSKGQVIRRATVKQFTELKPLLGPNSPRAKVAFECCREAWFLADQLREWGHEPVLVDTTKVKEIVGIGRHGRKNDRIDAERLAFALAEGRTPIAHELSPHRQQLRMALNTRAQLVSARATLVTSIKGDARARGVKFRVKGPQDFVAMVRETEMSQSLKDIVEPRLEVLTVLEKQIELVEEGLERLSTKESAVELLKTRPGVGAVVAAAFVAVIDYPERFRNAHAVESYLGIVPSENTSVKRRLGSITKQGNSQLRALLIQAAWTVLRAKSDDPLTQWGKAVAERRNKSISVVGIARRLVGILWAMWRDNRAYDARLLGQACALGTEKAAESQLFRAQALKKASKKKFPSRRAAKKLGGTNKRGVAVVTESRGEGCAI